MVEKKLNILIVDDDPEDCEIVSNMLLSAEHPTFEIETAQTIQQGIERLADGGIDVVMLDMNLPDSQDSEGFSALHAMYPQTPIVVVTGHSDREIGMESVKQGAEDYLQKGSFDDDLLIRTLTYACERNDLKRGIEKATITDSLTGLLNRQGFKKILSHQISWARRGMETVALLLNIDNFKKINRSLGQSAGDVILREIGDRLKRTLRTTDYIARISGDEFLILLPKTRLAETVLVGEKLRQAVSAMPVVIASEKVTVTASMGIAAVNPDSPSIDELIAKTHAALTRGKKARGDNQVSFEDPAMEKPVNEKHYSMTDIVVMLSDRKSYSVVKQALMDLEQLSPVGYEFLSRFCLSDFKNPDDFFRMCQENSLLSLVDHYCFKNCINASMELPFGYRFHFNLFPSTILAIDPYDLLRDFPKDIDPNRCCIEISEQQIIGDASNLVPAVRIFKKAGILIAMDDIGFGQSNLESLVLLEPDVVKIDKKCIIGVSQDSGRQRSLTRLVKILKSLEVEIIAEGIETEGDLKVVVDNGLKYGQGYLWGKPA